ncbi:hypothetical protein V8C43DRAFT_76720 [Trichoderma afarasin]
MNRLVRSTWSPSPPPICHDARNHGEPWADPIARLGKHKAEPSSFPASFSLWAEPPSGSVSALWRKQVSCRGSLSCNMQTTAMGGRDRHPTSKRASAVWFERRHYWLAPMYVMARTEESSVRPAANRGSPTTQLVGLMDACQCPAKAIRRSRS